MAPTAQALFHSLLYRRKRDRACRIVFIAAPESVVLDKGVSGPPAFSPVELGSSWPGPRASVFLGFCHLEELHVSTETRGCLCEFRPVAAARKESDQVLLFCFCSTLKGTFRFL